MFLRSFLLYVLAGVPINALSVITSWGILAFITEGHPGLFEEIYDEWWNRRVFVSIGSSKTLATLGSMIFWPINVLNNYVFGFQAIAEAREKIRQEGREENSALNDTERKEKK